MLTRAGWVRSSTAKPFMHGSLFLAMQSCQNSLATSNHFWEHRESNPGQPDGKRKRYQCAMPAPNWHQIIIPWTNWLISAHARSTNYCFDDWANPSYDARGAIWAHSSSQVYCQQERSIECLRRSVTIFQRSSAQVTWLRHLDTFELHSHFKLDLFKGLSTFFWSTALTSTGWVRMTIKLSLHNPCCH